MKYGTTEWSEQIAEWKRGYEAFQLGQKERALAEGSLRVLEDIREAPLESRVDELLAFIYCADTKRGGGSVRPASLRGVLPFLAMDEATDGGALLYFDTRPSDVRVRLDVSFMMPRRRDGDDNFTIHRFREVRAAEARGRYRRLRQMFVEHTQVGLRADGRYRSESVLWGSDSVDTPVVVAPWFVEDNRFAPLPIAAHDELRASLWLAFAHAATQEYLWSVDVGMVDGPSLRFNTDSEGAAEVFRLRDVPPGKSRRAALTHWVRSHWRKTRVNPDLATQVRAHLRGAQRFVWNDFVCTIRPSRDDAARALRPEMADAEA
jgi:hypothetical protein